MCSSRSLDRHLSVLGVMLWVVTWRWDTDGADRTPWSLDPVGQGNGRIRLSRAVAATRGNRPRSVVRRWLPLMARVIVIEPPYLRGLVLLRHRLAAPQIAQNAVRMAQVHL